MRTLVHADTLVEEKRALVCERPLFTIPRQLTELELQAHWFAGNFGRDFTCSDGEVIRIVQFGVWNHEAGPDFADAAVSVNGGAPKRGCIELDTDARDWERHGHAENPAYEDVILHVCLQSGPSEFFARTPSHRLVPRVLLDRSKLTHEPLNPLPEAQLGRCVGPLRNLSDERARAVLLAAAQVRLQRKAAALVTLRELHGADEALYQGLATTLGYKSNKLPLTLIAQRLPVRTLLGHKQEAAALLFGVSGFLNNVNLREFDNRTREYLRRLWALWWPHRTAFGRLVISPDLWRMTGQRPANHPQRRLAALAHMVGEWRAIRGLARKCEPDEIHRFFHGMSDEYWDFHYTLTSKASPRRMALVGESRVTEMLANIFFPLAIADDPRQWDAYLKVPAQLTNRRVEVAALRLFGESGRKRELLRWAAMQQGLLQIYEDFCMQDASDCEQCRFPEQLARW